MSFTRWLRNLNSARQHDTTARNGRRVRSKPAASFRPRLELLEERINPDAGDTLSTAVLTGLGPTVGSYSVSSEHLGDGSFGNKDVDMYQVNVNAGQFLTARTSQPAGGQYMDTILRLFDSSGNQLTYNDDSFGTAYSYVSHTFSTTGTYYVGVSGYPNFSYDPTVGGSGSSGSTGDFRLDLNLLTPTADAAGDTLATAQATNLGPTPGTFGATAKIGDGLYPDTDVDLYRVVASANQVLTATTSTPAGGAAMNPVLRVFDLAGNNLDTQYNGTASVQDAYQFASAGTYFIGVSGYSNLYYDPNTGGSGYAGQSTGDYHLDLALSTPTADAAGDTLQKAQNTHLGWGDGTYTATARIGDGLYPTRDVDLYQISASANQVLTVTTSTPAGGVVMTPWVRVFDGSGNEVATGYGYSTFQYQVPARGTYYVGVSGYGNTSYNPTVGGSGAAGQSTGDYQLNLTLVTPTPDAAGDTLATAQATNLGPTAGTFSATAKIGDGLYPNKDVDLYRVDVSAGQLLSAAMTLPAGGTPINYYPTLELFDSAGNNLSTNYGYSYSDANLNYQFTTAGTYYVGVSGYPGYNPTVGGSGYPGGAGDYTLNLTLATLTPDAAGDTIATAQATGLGPTAGTFSATAKIGDGLHPNNDVDLYQITVAAGQVLSAGMSLPAGGTPINFYPTLRLFTSSGVNLTTGYGYTNSTASFTYQIASAGTYYVGVSGYTYYDPNVAGSEYTGGGRGDYTLNLTLVTPTADSEGDTIATALATGLGTGDGTYTHTATIGDGLYPLKDVDLYQITASAGQLLTATTALPASGTAIPYTVLELFNSAGTQLGNYSSASISNTRIDYQFGAAGTYYIGVSGYPYYNPNIGGSGYQGYTGNYRLNLTLATPVADAEGDTIATALATGLGTADGSYTHTARIGDGLNPLRDVDMYQITVNAGQVVTANTSLPTGGAALYTTLRLFDSTGNQLFATSSYNSTHMDYQFATAGSYYIGISGYPDTSYNPNLAGTGTNGNRGDYTLNLTLTTPTADSAGDTLSTAQATGLGPANGTFGVTGHIGDGLYPLKDVDLYQFQASAGQGLIATPSQVAGGTSLTADLRLFDSTGNQLSITTVGSPLRFVFGASGTFYIGVSGYSNGSYDPNNATTGGPPAGGRGDYHLDLALVTPNLDSVGDTIGTALATGLGPTAGTYTMPSSRIGDGFFGNLDVDMYSFSAAAGQRFSTSMAPVTSGGTPLNYGYMRLFDAAGHQLAVGYSFNAIQNYTFAADGTYFLGVSGYGNFGYNPNVGGSGSFAYYTGDYSLTLTLVTPVADEPDTIALATATVLGPTAGTYGHTAHIGDGLYPQDDVDMYHVNAAANQLLRVTISQPAGGAPLAPALRIFDAAGHPLALNYSYYNGQSITLEYQFTTAGDYYVGVSGYYNLYYNPNVANSGYYYTSTGDYHLDLTLITPTPDAEGETIATAVATGLGAADGTYSHTAKVGDGLYFARDVDMYRIDAAAGQVVSAVSSVPAGGTPVGTYLRLFDASGNELSTGYEVLEFRITTAGTYYLGVTGQGNYSYDPTVAGSGSPSYGAGDYHLDLSLVTPTPDAVGDTIATALDTQLGPNAGTYTMPSSRIGDGLYVSRDVDMYEIRSQAGLVLTVSTSVPAGGTSVDIVLGLYDSSGNYLAQGYPNGDGTTTFQYTFPSHGTYYIGVSAAPNYYYDPNTAGSGYIGNHGDYRLDVRLDKPVNAPVGGSGQHVQAVTGHAVWHHTVGLPSGGQNIDQVSINAWLDASGAAHGTMTWSAVYHGLPDQGNHSQGNPYTMRVDTLVIIGNTVHVEGVVVRSGQAPGAIGSRVSWDIVIDPNGNDFLNGERTDGGGFTIH
jgi:hypothetical protein